MCGIAGILTPRADPARITPARLHAMIDALAHRGPDSQGFYLDDRVGLAHARLSIVDLAGGIQPIHNETESLWIVFNGEIFNHVELRADLEARGHTFYTDTDTEAILHLFETYGEACVQRLNGQFAFAIWNRATDTLFLARDRVGIRPLHYTIHDGALLFASEIKGIFAAGLCSPALDREALAQTFTLWTTRPGATVFAGIHELPPGHTLVVRPGAAPRRQRYWRLDFTPAQAPAPDTVEIVGRIQELLQDAVRLRLRADVPVGAYLSGGLDSSGLAALVARRFNADVHTYGLRFEAAPFDEGIHQALMIQHLGVQHRETTATNAAIAAALPDVVYHAERPLLRTAPVPMFLLSRLVRDDGLKVVLTGEGADEVFGGYNIFRETKIRRFWARQPESHWRHLLLRRLYPYVFRDPRSAATLKSFFARDLTNTTDPFYSHRIRWQNTARLRTFLADDPPCSLDAMLAPLAATLPDGFDRWDAVARAQYLEMDIFMGNYLLSSQGDRMAMAHSLEIRVPYLDHRLVEYMATVPIHRKIPGLHEKALLKQALAPLLPPAITARAKHPYRAPIAAALLAPDAPAYISDLLDRPALHANGIFEPRRVARLLAKLRQDSASSEVDNMALVGILTTQLLANRFLGPDAFRTSGRDKPADFATLMVDRRGEQTHAA
jgi:asparagine synthase (glutamine-hydrolysing)